MKRTAREVAKTVARMALGRLPRSAVRLHGALAIEGGRPVRDVRLRPWPVQGAGRRRDWYRGLARDLREIYLSGREGLPQERQKRFSAGWAERCGCRHALLLPHGTDALRIGLAAALDHDGLDYGGDVIVPNLSFIASATAALDRRLSVTLVDVDEETLLLDPSRLEAAIERGRTRAIIPVHQFGQPADMSRINGIAERHGLVVLEDAAQAHGAALRSGRVGALGVAGAFSFQSAKNLSCGEGGALTTNDDRVFDRAHSMHNAGREPGGGDRWEHLSLGWNCRPTEYQAAVLAVRERSFDAMQDMRDGNFRFLRSQLSGVDCVRPLGQRADVERHGMYMFAMRYRSEICGALEIDTFLEAVRAEGAPVYRAYAKTISQQEVFRGIADRRPQYVRVLETPVADAAVLNTIYVPGSAFLGSESDMRDIADAISKVERRFRGVSSRSRT